MDKLIKYPLTNAEFVAGEEELCFEEVIKDFKRAKYINILTYNISANSNTLLKAIRAIGEKDIPITIITNIPNRWEEYYYESSKMAAKKNIKIYERKLNPESIGRYAKVFFKFNNHGKIIMTNNIIYWGSANYSDESKKNYECGTLSRDKKFIQFVNDTVIPQILSASTSYYDSEYNNCLIALYSAVSYLHNIYQEIHDASYGYYNDYETNFTDEEYFDLQNNYITWNMLENLMEAINNWDNLINDLEIELIDNDKKYNEISLETIIDEYSEFISDTNMKIDKLCFEIEKLAKFDEDDFISDLLSNEYCSEAYDEKLDYYAQLAFEQGREKMEELIDDTKEDVKELLLTLDKYEIKMLGFIDKIMQIANLNEDIDNTSI